MSDAIPLLNTMFECYREYFVKLRPAYHNTLCSVLVEVHKLLCQHMPKEAFAAWSLTRHGRAHLRCENTAPGFCSRFPPEEMQQNANVSVENMKGRVRCVLDELESFEQATRLGNMPADYDNVMEASDEGFDEEELEEEGTGEEETIRPRNLQKQRKKRSASVNTWLSLISGILSHY